jgi:hypothetical protein
MYTVVECLKLCLVIGIVETQHRHNVINARKSLNRTAGDPLGRRVSRDELRVCGLKHRQLMQQLIEFSIGNFRVMKNVIPLFVMTDRSPEVGYRLDDLL